MNMIGKSVFVATILFMFSTTSASFLKSIKHESKVSKKVSFETTFKFGDKPCNHRRAKTPSLISSNAFVLKNNVTETTNDDLAYIFQSVGVAGPFPIWLNERTGAGVQACYEAVLGDSRCAKDYFSYVARGDLRCGCKSPGSLEVQGDANSNIYRIKEACVDIQPPGKETCQFKKDKGKCDSKWLQDNGYCRRTCGVCQPAEVEWCSKGIRRKNICCASSCGTCGGSSCSTNPGGESKCCQGAIARSGVACAQSSDVGCLVPAPTSQAWNTPLVGQMCKENNIDVSYHPDQCYKHKDRDGWSKSYGPSSNALCLNEAACKDLCASMPTCVSVEVHKTKTRCYLNDACINLVKADYVVIEKKSMKVCDTPHCEQCPGEQKCTKCAAGRYLSSSQTCLEGCPPGDYDTSDSAGLKCTRCDGEVVRTGSKPECVDCPNGHIEQAGHDKCQNIQDTCTPDQCSACEVCMAKAKPLIEGCMARHRSKATRNCLNFDEVWCHKFWGSLNDCEGYSMGCFFKLMCHDPCICPEWKAVRCGGLQSGTEAECDAGAMKSLLQGNASAMYERSKRSMAASKLHMAGKESENLTDEVQDFDQALSGKRTCM